MRPGAGIALGLVLTLAGCAAWPADRLTAEQHNDLGVAAFEWGDTRRAASEFARAVALRPGWARALVNLGDARLALGEVSSAIAAYERAASIAPDDPGVANNLAWALLQDPVRWPEAEPIITRALERRPEPRGYYLDTLGTVRLRQGDYRSALDTFHAALADHALPRGPARAVVLEHAAEAYVALGDPGAAARCRALAGSERVRAEPRDKVESGTIPLLGEGGSVC